ncbi:MAG: AMP-binding protein [Alphaproteobacteria bacterium]|nr:AMP-binding protein [Alphaproteobacteria bacterium]
MPMNDPLTDKARTQPDKPAVIDDRPDGTLIRWTYAELENNANRLGNALMALGMKPKDRIVWCGRNSTWIVAAIAAARKTGATAVPLNYRLAPEEAAYIIDNSDAAYVFADAEFAAMLAQIREDIPKVREIVIFDGPPGPGMRDAASLLAAADATPIAPVLLPGQANSMIYTSGTTGRPKGAYRDSAGNADLVSELMGLIGYRPDDVYITTGPLYHSGPASFMGMGIMLGQTVVLQRKFDPEDWLRLVDKYRVSSTFSAPTPIRRVCQLDETVFGRYDVSSMRILIANAAPWSYALKKMYLDRFPKLSLFEVYGSTELGVNTVLTPEYQLSKPGSCGKPAPGVEIFLLDDDGNVITTPHTPGELFIRSPGVFTEYYKARDQYLKDRRGDKQTVGDVAYFDEEGFFYICDRKKDMIISGGMNIYPAEIEDALEHHPDVMDVAVFGIPSEEWGESVHAVVVPRPGSHLGEQDVIAYARTHLAGYKVPRSVDFIEELPRTGSGKILKRELREPYWKNQTSKV